VTAAVTVTVGACGRRSRARSGVVGQGRAALSCALFESVNGHGHRLVYTRKEVRSAAQVCDLCSLFLSNSRYHLVPYRLETTVQLNTIKKVFQISYPFIFCYVFVCLFTYLFIYLYLIFICIDCVCVPASIMPACCPVIVAAIPACHSSRPILQKVAAASNPAHNVAVSPRRRIPVHSYCARSRGLVNVSCSFSCGMRWLLHATVNMMIVSAAFGIARAHGKWSTAELSVARNYLAATSVGDVAIFAGGFTASALLCMGNTT
jgi:hypothetical protein